MATMPAPGQQLDGFMQRVADTLLAQQSQIAQLREQVALLSSRAEADSAIVLSAVADVALRPDEEALCTVRPHAEAPLAGTHSVSVNSPARGVAAWETKP
ncbi:MAG: hypothetical protein ACK4NM_19230 [Hydrogenophaga sp.]